METQNRGSSTAFAEINPTTLSDVPSEQDGIGFAPYVRAIAWFLTAEKTKPPLTVSIEGPWGSGKSSFLLQLENQIRASARTTKSITMCDLTRGGVIRTKHYGQLLR
jgi:hypothetical protein